MAVPLRLFAACLPGLEPLLLAELQALGALSPTAVPGGVEFSGHRRLVARANLWLGTASHVLVRVGDIRAEGFDEFVRRATALPWDTVLRPGIPLDLRASARKCRLRHTGAIEQRTATAIKNHLGTAPDAGADPNSPAPAVVIRGVHDRFVFSVDTSGAPLHRRGWRLETGRAPLREDLAHALLLASGWDPATPLVDPFCGAGTIGIEAAALARGLAPGRQRRFALEGTVLFHEPTWRAVLDEARARALPRAPAPIRGTDRDAGAVASARRNAERACVGGDTNWDCAPVSRTEFPEDPVGAVVTNPPFGRRVGDVQRLRALYQTLGKRIAALSSGWRVGVLAADRRLALSAGTALETAFLTDHGGLKVRALVSPPRSP